MNKQLIAEYAQMYSNDESTIKWMKGYLADVVELNDGTLYAIEKPRIQKDFCFPMGYNGRYDEESERNANEMAHYARTNEQYFLDKNMRPILDEAKRFNINPKSYKIPAVHNAKYIGSDERIGYIEFFDNPEIFTHRESILKEVKERRFRLLEPDEIERIKNAYEEVIETFKKRLQTYLKKYGLIKLNVWTYLSD